MVAAIKDNSSRIAALAENADLLAPVPSCPEWTLGDLVFHLGAVQRFWAAALVEHNVDASPNLEEVDVDDAVLVSWAREQTDALVHAINTASPDAPCWTWWGEPRTAGAVARHQVQESAVHCWDACHALDEPYALASDVALDGIAEFLEVMAPQLSVPGSAHLSFQPLDATAVFTWGDVALPAVTLRATASGLVLAIYHRLPLDVVAIEGDAAVAQTWLDAMDLS